MRQRRGCSPRRVYAPTKQKLQPAHRRSRRHGRFEPITAADWLSLASGKMGCCCVRVATAECSCGAFRRRARTVLIGRLRARLAATLANLGSARIIFPGLDVVRSGRRHHRRRHPAGPRGRWHRRVRGRPVADLCRLGAISNVAHMAFVVRVLSDDGAPQIARRSRQPHRADRRRRDRSADALIDEPPSTYDAYIGSTSSIWPLRSAAA